MNMIWAVYQDAIIQYNEAKSYLLSCLCIKTHPSISFFHMPNEIWLLLFEYNTTFHGIKLYENIADCPWNSLVKKKKENWEFSYY